MERDKEILVWVIVAVILFVLMITGFGMGGYNMMGYGMGFGILFMVLFWGLIIWLVVSLTNTANQKMINTTEKPSEILRKRYAKGEISKKEFEGIKKELEK